MRIRHLLITGLSIVFCLLQYGLAAAEPAQTKAPIEPKAEPAVTTPELSEIIPLSTKLSARLTALSATGQTRLDLASIKEKCAGIEASINRYANKLNVQKEKGDYRATNLLILQQEIEDGDEQLKTVSKAINKEVSRLEARYKEWQTEKKQWSQWQTVWLEDEVPEQINTVLEKTADTIEQGVTLTSSQLETMLAEQAYIGAIQEKIDSLWADVRRLIENKRAGVLLKTAPPMFSPEYFSQFSENLWKASMESTDELVWSSYQNASQLGWTLLIQILVFAVLSYSILPKRHFLIQSTRWRFLGERPFAAIIFLICIVTLVVYEYEGSPPVRKLVTTILGAVAFARFFGCLTNRTWKKHFVYGLMFLLIMTRIMIYFNYPLPLFRLYIALACLVCLLFCRRWARQNDQDEGPVIYTRLLRLGYIFFTGILIAEIFGKDVISVYLFMSVVRTVTTSLAFLLLCHFIHGSVDWLFRASPLQRPIMSMFYGGDIQAVIRRVTVFLSIVLGVLIFLPGILTTWGVYENLYDATTGFCALGFNVGSQRITLGQLVIVAGVLVSTFVISRIFRKLLLGVVLQKGRIERGVQLSIERLIHYVVIFIGFVIVVSMLGFELTKLTIVLSALSVGIGFGLQGIVNNFVSGLILLFERPIRAGDTVEIAGQWAEVKRIGLRATTLQTFDQADLIIPNADLTTNQVTNWTLSSRQVRLIVPVGVAYGSDIPQVMQTLTECARTNSMVVKSPEPQVLFLKFGESSLDFELRVWVNDAEYRLTVKSALHEEIDRRFREKNIVIAFPQRDVHIHSTDKSNISPTS